VLWAPDRHLGRYIQEQTGADMLLWQGDCIVHDEFKGLELDLLRREHPGALVLVHPESPRSVVEQADLVGSTSQLLKAVVDGTAPAYIVATDQGILHRMRQLAPGKTLIEAPTAGKSATCKSCAHCPWMAMNAVQGVVACLEDTGSGRGEILVPEDVRRKALVCIDRMLEFVRQHPASVAQPATRTSAFVPNIGPA
jgi:quinolinate synthase